MNVQKEDITTGNMTEDLQHICGTSDPFWLALRGGNTRRFHTQGRLFDQNVAEHTWRMMVVLHTLWPNSSAHLLRAALFHDASEGIYGDLPAPVKRAPGMKAIMDGLEEAFMRYAGLPGEHLLSDEDFAKLKCADYLELAITCAQVGTEEGQRIHDTALGYVTQLCKRLPTADSNAVYMFADHYLEGGLNP